MKAAGSYVALITPFLKDGSVDLSSIKSLIEWHVQCGTTGIVLLGSTGETATLTAEEKKKIIEIGLKTSKSRVPIIVGVGTNCTASTVQNAIEAEVAGCDALLVSTPYYNKPPQRGMFEHFSAVCKATKEIPIILYNVPGRTSSDLKPETVLQLLDAHPKRIVSIKEASTSERFTELRKLLGNRIAILSGEDDETCQQILDENCDGSISVTANVAPVDMASMVEAALNKDESKALKINQKLMGFHKRLFLESNPIPVKYAMWCLGKIDNASLRLPLTELSDEFKPKIDELCKELS